ncbi:hypothetical protein KRMM14A1259_67530 [Krasilnikovia sp. MM14-A1259]
MQSVGCAASAATGAYTVTVSRPATTANAPAIRRDTLVARELLIMSNVLTVGSRFVE